MDEGQIEGVVGGHGEDAGQTGRAVGMAAGHIDGAVREDAGQMEGAVEGNEGGSYLG